MDTYSHYGYIAITDPQWLHYNICENADVVTFWRRGKKPVKLDSGTPFFFLVKGTKPRVIRGYGLIRETGYESIENLFNKFGRIGAKTLEEVEVQMGRQKDTLVGYYLLEKVKYFEFGVDPNSLNIEFKEATVSGKVISYNDTQKILKALIS